MTKYFSHCDECNFSEYSSEHNKSDVCFVCQSAWTVVTQVSDCKSCGLPKCRCEEIEAKRKYGSWLEWL